VLLPRTLRIIEDLATDWRRLDERIESLSGEIKALPCQDSACDRLMTVPDIMTIALSLAGWQNSAYSDDGATHHRLRGVALKSALIKLVAIKVEHEQPNRR
jgi:transposase